LFIKIKKAKNSDSESDEEENNILKIRKIPIV
jgi:hypothetical protein